MLKIMARSEKEYTAIRDIAVKIVSGSTYDGKED